MCTRQFHYKVGLSDSGEYKDQTREGEYQVGEYTQASRTTTARRRRASTTSAVA